MSEYLKQLTEARLKAWESGKEVLDRAASEKREMSGEETKAFESASADMDRIDVEIKKLGERDEQRRDIEAVLERMSKGEQIAPAPGAGKVDADEDALRFFRGDSRKSFNVAIERRDNLKLTAAAGGATVPTSFYGRLWAHMIEVSSLLRAGVTVLTTNSGEPLDIPTTTAHSTAVLVAEGAVIPESDPAFARRTLSSYKYASLHQVSTELIVDTGVDLLGYLAMQAGRAAGNAFGAALMTGTGGGTQPSGIVPGAAVGITGAAAVGGAFTPENLIDLFYSVISPYRDSPQAAWLVRDATMGAIRKLRENGTTGAFLFQPALTVGTPDTLLAKPIYTDPGVPAVGLAARSVIFGDMSAYFARVVGGIRFERSDEFAFNQDLVTFRSILRGDGLLVDQTGAVKAFVGNAA